MEVFWVIGVLVALMLLWLNFLAMFAVKYDHTLDPVQRFGQLIFIWVIPFIGASAVLYIVYEHSPEAIPKSWIPWPFKGLIFGKSLNLNALRNDSGFDDGYTRHPDQGVHGGSDSSSDGGD